MSAEYGAAYATEERDNGAKYPKLTEPEPLDSTGADEPDIYSVFYEVTGRDYSGSETDELEVLTIAHAWEQGYRSQWRAMLGDDK